MRRPISAAFHFSVLAALLNALLLLLRNLRYLRLLEDELPASGDDLPSINVVIPARNNEVNALPRCLDSLRNRRDRRTGRTLLPARTRCRLIKGASLPEGWTVEPWTC